MSDSCRPSRRDMEESDTSHHFYGHKDPRTKKYCKICDLMSRNKQLFLMCQAYEHLICALEANIKFDPGIAKKFKSKELIQVRESLNQMLRDQV